MYLLALSQNKLKGYRFFAFFLTIVAIPNLLDTAKRRSFAISKNRPIIQKLFRIITMTVTKKIELSILALSAVGVCASVAVVNTNKIELAIVGNASSVKTVPSAVYAVPRSVQAALSVKYIVVPRRVRPVSS